MNFRRKTAKAGILILCATSFVFVLQNRVHSGDGRFFPYETGEEHNLKSIPNIPFAFRAKPVDPFYQKNCEEHGSQGYLNKAYAEFVTVNPSVDLVKGNLNDAIVCNGDTTIDSEVSTRLTNEEIDRVQAFHDAYNAGTTCWPSNITVSEPTVRICPRPPSRQRPLTNSSSEVEAQGNNDILPTVVGILGELIIGAVQSQSNQNPQPAPQAPPRPTVVESQIDADRLLAQWGWERVECTPELVLIFGLGEGVICIEPMPPNLTAGQYRYDVDNNRLIQIRSGQTGFQEVGNSSSPTIVPIDE